jgi:hypothetical protein
LHLASCFSKDSVWFDDCVCQDHGFEAVYVEKLGCTIKDLVTSGAQIIGKKNGRQMSFATINCSWVPIEVFQWVEQATLSPHTVDTRLSNHLKLSFRRSLGLRSKRFLKKIYAVAMEKS